MDAVKTDRATPEEHTSQEPSKAELDKVVRYHVWGAMGVGLVPVPLVDVAGIMGIQLNLLRMLARMYGAPFRKDASRNIVSAFLGGVAPAAIEPTLFSSVVKIIPVMGQTAGVVSMPILAGASTYAIGKVFIQHFASGGTFLTFDPQQVKAYYAHMFAEGKDVAAEMRKQSRSDASEG